MPTWNERAAQALEEAMGRLGTWVALGLLVLVAALIAGIGTHKASPGPSGLAAGISLFVLGATLLAVLWYSLETRCGIGWLLGLLGRPAGVRVWLLRQVAPMGPR